MLSLTNTDDFMAQSLTFLDNAPSLNTKKNHILFPKIILEEILIKSVEKQLPLLIGTEYLSRLVCLDYSIKIASMQEVLALDCIE